MSEKGYEPDIEPRRVNVSDVPRADVELLTDIASTIAYVADG